MGNGCLGICRHWFDLVVFQETVNLNEVKNPSHNTWGVGYKLEISLPLNIFPVCQIKRLWQIDFHGTFEYTTFSMQIVLPQT